MFDVKRQDKPVIQSIAIIDQLDKDINSFCMRIKEWFSWHFPELSKIVTDIQLYVKLVNLIETKANLKAKKEEITEQINELTNDEALTKQIVESALVSMGADFSDMDSINIKLFCNKVIGLFKYRDTVSQYLKDKMKAVAPNLSQLVGEVVGARLISHAGSLGSLAKYPASTIQILGAEKALFRALKTKGKTPKYGLLYHSSFIGRAQQANKGKISRFLANKIAICARIDYFTLENVYF
jgi:nucleolar protein 56